MSDDPNVLSVELPLPPLELSKNGRADRWKRGKLYREHRTWACRAVQGAYPTTADAKAWDGPIAVEVRWFKPGGPDPDRDNAIGRLAAYFDGCQDARLFLNDRQIADVQLVFSFDRDRPRVELTFRHDGKGKGAA